MTPSVFAGVVLVMSSGALSQRNDRLDSCTCQAIAQPVGIEGLVADHGQTGNTGHENVKACDVVLLARQKSETDEVTEGVDQRRDLRRQATPRPAYRLLLSPPFAPVPC